MTQNAKRRESDRLAERPSLGIVIPALDAGDCLAGVLKSLQEAEGLFKLDLVIVDGGSADETVDHAQRARARVLETVPDRAQQVQAGLDIVFGDWILVLDARSRLKPGWAAILRAFTDQKGSDRFAGHGKLITEDHNGRRIEEGAVRKFRNQFSGTSFCHNGFVLHRRMMQRMGGPAGLGALNRMEIHGKVGAKYLIPLPFQAVNRREHISGPDWTTRMGRVAGWILFCLMTLPPSAVAHLPIP